MTPRFAVPGRVLAAVAIAAVMAEQLTAQYGTAGTARQEIPWENNRLRIAPLSLEPGAALPAAGNQVLVYLTADAAGRMPPEAVWRPSGAEAVSNRGPARVEAIAIELKDVERVSRGTPPEALAPGYGVNVTTIIDNAHVLVTKHHYEPHAYSGAWHFHPEDVLVVYLRGGYTWPPREFPGASRIRRGDVEVIPANTLHRVGNAGSDPLELLVIVPR